MHTHNVDDGPLHTRHVPPDVRFDPSSDLRGTAPSGTPPLAPPQRASCVTPRPQTPKQDLLPYFYPEMEDRVLSPQCSSSVVNNWPQIPSSHSPVARPPTPVLSTDCLLSDEDFIEELVSEVRRSCQGPHFHRSSPPPPPATSYENPPTPTNAASVGPIMEEAPSTVLHVSLESSVDPFLLATPHRAMWAGMAASQRRPSVRSHPPPSVIAPAATVNDEEPLMDELEVTEVFPNSPTLPHPSWAAPPKAKHNLGWNQSRPPRKSPPAVSAPGKLPPPPARRRAQSCADEERMQPASHRVESCSRLTQSARDTVKTPSHRLCGATGTKSTRASSLLRKPVPVEVVPPKPKDTESVGCNIAMSIPPETARKPTMTKGVRETRPCAATKEDTDEVQRLRQQVEELMRTTQEALSRAASAEERCEILALRMEALVKEHQLDRREQLRASNEALTEKVEPNSPEPRFDQSPAKDETRRVSKELFAVSAGPSSIATSPSPYPGLSTSPTPLRDESTLHQSHKRCIRVAPSPPISLQMRADSGAR